MSIERLNDDLDSVFGVKAAIRKSKRVRRADRDAIRRRAFKVLALIADLSAKERLAVLKAATRLNKA